LRKVKDGDDAPAIDQKTSDLSQSMQKIGEAMAKSNPSSEEKKDTEPTDVEAQAEEIK